MLLRSNVVAVLGGATCIAAQSSDGGYWLNQTLDVLTTMQDTYWNGTYWPSTIQWIGAVLNTFLSTSNILFTDVLEEYYGSVPGAQTSASSLQGDIATFFNQTEAYYGAEETIQIFDAAYDDVQWVVLEWLEAITFVQQYDNFTQSSMGQDMLAEFAHRAHVFYNVVQNEFNTSLCGGGLTWNPALATYKNAITNTLFVASSISMYLSFPGDNNSDPYPSPDYQSQTGRSLPPLPSLAPHAPLLLHNAVTAYAWFQSQPFYNAQGLIIDGFHVAANQTACNEPNAMVYSYNQGVVLTGLRGLWEATGETGYLADGYGLIGRVVNATGWNATSGKASASSGWPGLGRGGIMEDYCDAGGTCDQDARVFKGVYFHHLAAFCAPLPTQQPRVPGVSVVAAAALAAAHAAHCASYAAWVRHNAAAALATRNASAGLIGEWWGASPANGSAAAAVSLPSGAVDIVNQPWRLDGQPWACEGACGSVVAPARAETQRTREAARVQTQRTRGTARDRRRDSDNQVTSVETQGQGLSVVLAAADLTLRWPAT